MSDGAIFPYGITFREDGAVDVFPAAQVFFPYKDGGEVPFFLLIDSGAYISALPKSDAESLGVKADSGEPVLISGISGSSVRGWHHNIAIRLGGKIIKLPIVFINDDSAPRILGRAGVFGKFSIIFEEQKKRSGFLESGGKEAKSVGKILSRLG